MLPIVSLYFVVAVIFSSVCSLHDAKNHVLPAHSELTVLPLSVLVGFTRL